MVRVKIVLSSGSVFLSPFIYTESAAWWLIHRINKWHKTFKYEHIDIPFGDCFVDCLYNQTWEIDDMISKIPLAESIWRNSDENYERIGDARC